MGPDKNENENESHIINNNHNDHNIHHNDYNNHVNSLIHSQDTLFINDIMKSLE